MREGHMKGTNFVVAGFGVLFLFAARPAVAGPAKNGKAVAYAKVNLNDASVRSFGGKTSAAVGTLNSPGDVNVVFTGKFPKGITIDQVIVQATCEYGGFCVANGQVDAAS